MQEEGKNKVFLLSHTFIKNTSSSLIDDYVYSMQVPHLCLISQLNITSIMTNFLREEGQSQ